MYLRKREKEREGGKEGENKITNSISNFEDVSELYLT